MTTDAIFTFVGGIGLFLLGMRLMTDGLKVAAGDTLRSILTAATRSRMRGLASGVLITAMVQSSSAVIFATVGFVNAGLLTLYQAIGIIYGSNLGTTLTSWIVALLGFNVDLRAMAMPAIGIGMALWVAFGTKRYGALGHALAGFGLFFLGIDVLKDAFAGIGDVAALENWAGRGVLSLLLFMLIGILLTVLMQSSSAALAVTLTAAAGGLIPLTAAAAMVIGANVGTTSTAAFAVIGATAPAKRAASAHVVFNIITAIAAFIMLPVLLWIVAGIAHLLRFDHQPATSLAIFHTMTKVMGIAIMWPLTSWMVKILEGRFRSVEEDESRPRFLDHNVQATPSLAMDALGLELHRMGSIARDIACDAISSEDGAVERLSSGHRALEELNVAVGEFTSGISRNGADPHLFSALPDALRVGQYLVNVAETSVDMGSLQTRIELNVPELSETRNQLRAHAVDLISHANVDTEDWNPDRLAASRQNFEEEYQAFKNRLLHAGTAGNLSPRRMAVSLEQMSALHRIVDQATKSAIYLDRYIKQIQSPTAATEESDTANEPSETKTEANLEEKAELKEREDA